jgi:DNA-binding response OmpR family regulator
MKRRVLVADDDPVILSLVGLRLGLARYDVLSATCGDSARAAIREKAPEAVILDVQMPGGGGLSVLNDLKADPATRELPVMMLTGDRGGETVLKAMDAGAGDYMVKPFDPDRLVERLSRLIRTGTRASAIQLPVRQPPVWEL